MSLLQDLLLKASRTFTIGINRLPAVLRESVTVAYLLLRVSDYFEDNEVMKAQEKVEALLLWDRVLAGAAETAELVSRVLPEAENPDAEVAQHTVEILDRLHRFPAMVQEIIIKHVSYSTRGMAYWVNRGPIVNDETDLDNYMFEVAGRVGYLLTDLFSWYSATIRRKKDLIMPLAREFGLALQTVNVIRGLREDFERGWVFVPAIYCSAVQLSPDQLFQADHSTEALKVLDMLVQKAEGHLRNALTYIQALPVWQHGIRLFCIFPFLFAVRTLAVSRANIQVFESEVRITRDEVKRIVVASTLWGWSNSWLTRYTARLQLASAL